MTKLYTTIILCLLALSIQAQTTASGTITHDGGPRTYSLTIPTSYTGNAPLPLVLNLHGIGTDGSIQRGYSQFDPVAEANDFFVVYPNGLDLQWDSGFGTGVDDVGFLSDLIDTLSMAYNIDPNRVYSTGMSNGGFQSYQLACELSDKIAAIASVTGALPVVVNLGCNPTHPMPVMQIHGTADGTVLYLGQWPNYFGALAGVEEWVAKNNCNPTPDITNVPDINTADNCTASRYYYTGCDGGAEVELYRVDGGGHTWPGTPIVIGVTNQDFSASEVIWEFFNRFTLDGLSTAVSSVEDQFSVHLMPNPIADYLNINWTDETVQHISILNVAGKTVYQIRPQNDETLNISTTDWTPGLYFIQLKTNKGIVSKKVIKQ